ncbi:MAG TPA: hypothetical protein VME63_04370 [Dyella sp.]|uniref:hypothetical protein n=1 Tax=Dyella sp. TaxID=1869338 RepID=UPI002CD2EEAB|nr:hypothetical protein [Dyella sp.]HTV84614.1 hypothetical protein [Dyella sp.]
MLSISVNSQDRYSSASGDFCAAPCGSGPSPVRVERPAGSPPGAPDTPVSYQGPGIPPQARNASAASPSFNASPVRAERPAGTPPGAPDTPVTRLRSGDLHQYRVSPNHLRGLQPDRNGIYTRTLADRSRHYFADVDGDIYRVGGFDRQSLTWQVLDPRSGKEVAPLQRTDGKWTAAAAPASYPRGYRGTILRALDGGIHNVILALTQVRGNWSRATSATMNTLFGRGASSEGGKARIEQGLRNTLNQMQESKRTGARNLQVGGEGGPNSPSAVAFGNGTVQFTKYTLRNWRPADLNELMVHEFTHTGAGTKDHWYLNRNNGRIPNWGGSISPLTFHNAVNNADTLARSSSVLANN